MGVYRRIHAWQAAHELALAVYDVTRACPRSERYGLTAQVRRAFSAPCNIVEGSMRRGRREFRRFLDVALGSIAEVEYTIDFAVAAGVAAPADAERLSPLIWRAGGLSYRLARSLDPTPPPG